MSGSRYAARKEWLAALTRDAIVTADSANARLNCSYLRRGKNAALLLSELPLHAFFLPLRACARRMLSFVQLQPPRPLESDHRITHRDGKRFIVKADDLLTAFLSLERNAIAQKDTNGNGTRHNFA